MAETIIDVRGLSCPEPVVQTKKALALHSAFTVLVDSETAKENILRFCSNAHAQTQVCQMQDAWQIAVSR
ncbi:MAG: sulfurtransferase TusA family protein [Treponema sp.]